MEFDVGTIIYIIITIVAVIAGAAGKKKKRPNAPASGSSGVSGLESFFSKLEDQFIPKQEVIEEDPDKEASFEKPFDEENVVLDEDESEQFIQEPAQEESEYSGYEGIFNSDAINYQELVDSEGIMSASDKNQIEVIDLDDEELPEKNDLFEDFDLQKAVIYSIVLDRVEY